MLNKIYSLDGNAQEELSLCNGCQDEHRLEKEPQKKVQTGYKIRMNRRISSEKSVFHRYSVGESSMKAIFEVASRRSS